MISTSRYGGGAMGACDCQNPGGAGLAGFLGDTDWISQGNGTALNPANGVVGYIVDPGYKPAPTGTLVPNDSVSVSLADSVPGGSAPTATTSFGDDLRSALRLPGQITTAAGGDPFWGPLLNAGLSQIPGMGVRQPPPQPVQGPSLGTVGLVLGGLTLGGLALKAATSR